MKKELRYGIYAAVAAIVVYWLLQLIVYSKARMESPFKYFAWREFDSPDKPGSGKTNMSEDFIRKLDNVRAACGFPFIITSGYRTPAHNAKVGEVGNSSHIKGLAVDIAAVTDAQKNKIAKAAIAGGITRIGWGRTFIHLDVDPDKTQNIVWNYGNTAPTFTQLSNNQA